MKPAMLFVFLLVPGVLPAAEWELAWSDEFDSAGLPDSSKWNYEEGFVRNQELQYYTRARQENARVEDGMLVIEGRKERYKNPKYNPASQKWPSSREYAGYTAASLTTQTKASWRYGRVEVRAKIPQGKGVWPAIWMLGDNIGKVGWPACGEIDIMEFVGKDPNHVHATVHYKMGGKHRSSGNKLQTETPYADFHIYAMEWHPDRMDFFFDDTKYHTFQIDDAGTGDDNPFRKPKYLILNLALGGSWGGEMDDSVLPQKFLIDYVRVYK
ncbi:MAG: glycoside hydrolase family 16 protein [Candidatus Sumerlaeota bacterium]|nr:glycoside hydrolase family 16 protein [Candidatus Sumerlaeota bacterium]